MLEEEDADRLAHRKAHRAIPGSHAHFGTACALRGDVIERVDEAHPAVADVAEHLVRVQLRQLCNPVGGSSRGAGGVRRVRVQQEAIPL